MRRLQAPVGFRILAVGTALSAAAVSVGARPWTVWASNPAEQAELSPDPTPAGPGFGTAVALSADGNTAIVGAEWGNPDSYHGAAYIFTRSGGTWTKQAFLTAGDSQGTDAFGISVALSANGNIALIGASSNNNLGAAYIYTRSSTTWSLRVELRAPDGTKSNSPPAFGESVALSGDGTTAVIGAPGMYSEGAGYIYTGSGSSWSLQSELATHVASSTVGFGTTASISGDGTTTAIGGDGVYVYTRGANAWSLQAELPNAYGGSSTALSANGGVLLGSNCCYVDSYSSVYVFTRSSGAWKQQAVLTAADKTSGDYFGSSVALTSDGSSAIIGAPGQQGGGGAEYVFARSGTAWTQRHEFQPTGTDSYGSSGFGGVSALDARGDTALIATGYDGDAYVFVSSTGPDPSLTAHGNSRLYSSTESTFSGAVATFTDGDPSGTATEFSATVDWGDGSAATQGDVAGSSATGFTVSALHNYQTVGYHKITTTIDDAGGATATAKSTILTYAFSNGNNQGYVIGDRSASVNTAAYFWGSNWSQRNTLSGGASRGFLGFAYSTFPNPPTCGSTFKTYADSQKPAPSTIPAYVGVLVSNRIRTGGSGSSKAYTGDVVGIAIVHVNAGYGPEPSSPGTGPILAVLSGSRCPP